MSDPRTSPPLLGLAPGEIRIDRYDPRWSVKFQEIRERLYRLVPEARIEHIGSTSIPGCDAKPIIDVSVGLSPNARFGADEARAAGFELRSVRSYSAIFALADPSGRRIAHVHVRALGSEAELDDLRFRDYLRVHPEAIREHGETKRRILSTRSDRAGYTRAKEPFIEGLSEPIRKWAEEVGWSPGAPSGRRPPSSR